MTDVKRDWDDERYEHPWRDPELMEQLYCEEKMSTVEIGRELDSHQSTIYKWITRHGISTRKSNREIYPRPITYTYGHDQGYELIEHDMAEEKACVRHHRLIAVAEYGLDSVIRKDVHHMNGIPWDNRVENLELLEPSAHSRKHQEERYGDKLWRDEDTLRELYVGDDRSFRSIARVLDTDHHTIIRWLERFGLREGGESE